MPISMRFVKSMPSTPARKPWTKCCRDCSPSVTMSMPAASCSRSASTTASRLASARASPESAQGAHSARGCASHAGLGRLPAIVVSRLKSVRGLNEEGGRGLVEHRRAAHLLIEERHDRADAVAELLVDRPEVLLLHTHAVPDELRRALAEGLSVQHHVHDH